MTTPPQLLHAFDIMEVWLGLPEDDYKARVYMFADRLSPQQVLEAVRIAVARLPHGGRQGLLYFYGVCHNMIREERIRRSWN